MLLPQHLLSSGPPGTCWLARRKEGSGLMGSQLGLLLGLSSQTLWGMGVSDLMTPVFSAAKPSGTGALGWVLGDSQIGQCLPSAVWTL